MSLRVQSTLKSYVKEFPRRIGYMKIITGGIQIRVAISQYPLGNPKSYHSNLFEDTYLALERGAERIINKLNVYTRLDFPEC